MKTRGMCVERCDRFGSELHVPSKVRRVRPIAIAACAGLFIGAAQGLGAFSLGNASFEDPILGAGGNTDMSNQIDWTLLNAANYAQGIFFNDGTAGYGSAAYAGVAGNQAAFIDAKNAAGVNGVFQKVTDGGVAKFVKGNTYTLTVSVALRDDDNPVGSIFTMAFGSGAANTLVGALNIGTADPALVNKKLVVFTTSYTALAADNGNEIFAVLQVDGKGAKANTHWIVDDVVVTPAPGTLLLGAVSLVMMGRRRR